MEILALALFSPLRASIPKSSKVLIRSVSQVFFWNAAILISCTSLHRFIWGNDYLRSRRAPLPLCASSKSHLTTKCSSGSLRLKIGLEVPVCTAYRDRIGMCPHGVLRLLYQTTVVFSNFSKGRPNRDGGIMIIT